MSQFRSLFQCPKILIGVVHLPPLPGYAECPGMQALAQKALTDLSVCEQFKIDGVLIENEYDRPHCLLASREVTAAMASITQIVQAAASSCVTGCEILLNDPYASLAAAKAGRARFIRTDYFVDPMYREGYGNMEIDAEKLLAYRKSIDAEDVLIFADIQVKYATMLVDRSLEESAKLARLSGADGIVVTGTQTGVAPSVQHLKEAKSGAGTLPVLIGSGCDSGNAYELLTHCDGALVGTALIENGQIDPDRARNLARVRDNLLQPQR